MIAGETREDHYLNTAPATVPAWPR